MIKILNLFNNINSKQNNFILKIKLNNKIELKI